MAHPRRNSIKDLRQRIRELEEETASLRMAVDAACESPHRRRLPSTRNSLTHKFAIDQYEGYITVGLYDDDRPGELFLTMAKEGSTIGGLMDTIGILTSLALQYGVSVEILARKFEHVSFEPSGWTREPNIRRASSVVDYVFRWLGLHFSEAYRQEKLAIHDHAPGCDTQSPLSVRHEDVAIPRTDAIPSECREEQTQP